MDCAALPSKNLYRLLSISERSIPLVADSHDCAIDDMAVGAAYS